MNFDQDIPVKISPKKLKTITWETDYNKKMSCDTFIHVTYAPSVLPSREDLNNIVINITTKDGSHEPITRRIYDILIIKAKKLPDAFSFMSHGMTMTEFINEMWMGRKETFNYESDLCVYFYVDVNKQLL